MSHDFLKRFRDQLKPPPPLTNRRALLSDVQRPSGDCPVVWPIRNRDSVGTSWMLRAKHEIDWLSAYRSQQHPDGLGGRKDQNCRVRTNICRRWTNLDSITELNTGQTITHWNIWIKNMVWAKLYSNMSKVLTFFFHLINSVLLWKLFK